MAWKIAWDKLAASAPATLQSTMKNSFSFKALPEDECPYDPRYCVPFPGIGFSMQSIGFYDTCLFQMQSDVLGGASDVAAQSLQQASSAAEGAAEGFGSFIGDLMVTIDSFCVVCACAFVIGFVFLILLGFIVRPLVYSALVLTFVLFAVVGISCFAKSGQCKGESLQSTTEAAGASTANLGQAAVTGAIAGENILANLSQEEEMIGLGGDYRGGQVRTQSGRLCQEWDVQTPWSHSTNSTTYPSAGLLLNYCRNPDELAPTIWCFTTDTEQRWELCTPLGVILKECPNGYEVENEMMREGLKIIAYILWSIAGLWVIAVCCFFSRIQLAILINQKAAEFVIRTPTVIFVPVIQVLLCIGWAFAWFYSAAFLLSQVPDGYIPTTGYETYAEAFGTADTPGKCTGKWPTGGVWKDELNCEAGTDLIYKCWKCYPPRYTFDVRFAISFFQYLWQNALLIAIGQCVIAMACGIWFFSKKANDSRDMDTSYGKGGLTVKRAVGTVLRYHLGSLAFGAFILAVVQFIRYLLKFYEKQAQAQKNKIMVMILKCLQCLIWCFEQCVKFLNKNAYIQIALMGTPFCTSAKKAFYMILRNFIRFGVVAMLGVVIKLLGVFAITVATVVLGYYIFVAMHPEFSPIIPVILYIFVGYVVAKLYINVFQMAVDTILQCFIIVEESGSGGEHVCKKLRKLVDDNPPPKKPSEGDDDAGGDY